MGKDAKVSKAERGGECSVQPAARYVEGSTSLEAMFAARRVLARTTRQAEGQLTLDTEVSQRGWDETHKNLPTQK